MRTLKLSRILLYALILSFLTNCKEREITNPFDDGCPKELFTPSEFKVVQEGTVLKLTWVQTNLTINGFVINRSENDGVMAEVARIDKAVTSWTDTKVVGGTKYVYQLNAYAGANLSNPLQSTLTTSVLGPTVVTAYMASGITSNSAVLGGNVTSDGGASVTERGICYGTTPNPTISNSKVVMGSGTGEFSAMVNGLTQNTTYYAKAYATNTYATSYGSEMTFTTTQLQLATVTTADATNIGFSTVNLGGNVTSDGSSTVTDRGICYSISQNPTTANSKVPIGSGTGAFESTITGLAEAKTYYVRAYAVNSMGTAYGAEINFTTTQAQLATVSTAEATSVSASSATLGGNVLADGNSIVTERGICYSSSQNPTTSNSKVAMGKGLGAYSNTVNGLASKTTYYVRAFAINGAGTAYGSQVTLTTGTELSLPTVTTSAATNLSTTNVVLGGNITSDGGGEITERGIRYHLTNNLSSAPKVIMGKGTGIFSGILNGLDVNTTYYAAAYAINSAGTTFGNMISFRTLAFISIPTVTTIEANSISQTAATSGGNITADGGGAVTARGICYGTNQNPTLSDNVTTDGSGIGQFVSQLTNLPLGTVHYIRAYATNSAGTGYGAQVTFTTLKGLPILTTKNVTEITAMGGVSGGIISSTGGGTITAKGICWGELPNPALTDNVISTGTGPSQFNSSIVSAIPGTTYYVRSFATNEVGTGYGDQKSFTALGNVNYYGFESGMLPVGWGGQWTVTSSKGFQSNYSLASLPNVASDATLTVNIANSGQISFYYFLTNGTIDFYVDGVIVGNFPTSAGWNQGFFNVSAGSHTFKWHFNPNWANGGNAYIDYIIFPK